MKQLEVQIMGQSYLLGCQEGGEERLLGVAHQVDQAMCKIRDAGKVRARDRIAVLRIANRLINDGINGLRARVARQCLCLDLAVVLAVAQAEREMELVHRCGRPGEVAVEGARFVLRRADAVGEFDFQQLVIGYVGFGQ